MKIPLLSIITVVYNNKEGLIRTLESIEPIQSSKTELIIIDGGSDDGTLDVINDYSDLISLSISEEDQGIFDAMNKGILLANGKWIIFINSDDEIRFNINIVDTLERYTKAALVYGNTELSDGSISYPLDLNYIEKGALPMCHQSTFYNSELLGSELYYKTNFKLFGENELYMRIHKNKAKYESVYIDQTFSFFKGGGISEIISWETRIARYYYLFTHFGLRGILNGMNNKLKHIINN